MLSGVASGGVWSYDNLHLTAASYQKWVEKLCDQYLLDGERFHPYYPNNASEQQQNGGLSGSHGMRATYFSVLPIQSDDILFFGDEEVKNGEWNELFGIHALPVTSKNFRKNYVTYSINTIMYQYTVSKIFMAVIYVHIINISYLFGLDDNIFQHTTYYKIGLYCTCLW